MLAVSTVRLFPGSHRDVESGLLGYVQFTLNGALCVDGVTLRRTRDNRLTLSYPAKRTPEGWDYHYIRPLDDQARRDIERQVFEALDLDREGAR